MEITCDKCGATAEGANGHIGKRHQACKRKKGSGTSRKNCGKWILKS
ncbi:hypothetical protein LCGC14_1035920 [marine sediment metagenome]|uniref:Uncharacterized protein n=1 Tax=marine sediment metagenome TaxID=412755 RepID=A0A0F9NEV4_9ZZZZ